MENLIHSVLSFSAVVLFLLVFFLISVRFKEVVFEPLLRALNPSTVNKRESKTGELANADKESESKSSRVFSMARTFLSKDSREALLSIHRNLLLDAREMRKNSESESVIRKKIHRQMVMAYFTFATAPLTRALRAPFRWRRD